MTRLLAELAEKDLNKLEESDVEEELDELNQLNRSDTIADFGRAEQDGPQRGGSKPEDKTGSAMTFQLILHKPKTHSFSPVF
ncbi:unnamed protein product [Eruca vesicaria subsp. sativa]|uniref:Uncharacterized protein n=1 Tax=Eruca vesicaria subsp. sativa TaxID=29727 RepID=A0ABC8L9P8_ERUVS|nr:unnamed protein product [Eruca vesicaria subsp. sativa]